MCFVSSPVLFTGNNTFIWCMYICTKDRYILLTFTVLKLLCGISGIMPYLHITPIDVVHSL